MDDIRPPRLLSRGASDDAKQKVTRNLKEAQDRVNDMQPEFEQTKLEHDQLLAEVQDLQHQTKDTKAKIQTVQKLSKKLENCKRKQKEAQEKLETDDEEEKKQLVEKLKQRVVVSLKAMSAHSESYKLMMEATVKTSGAKLNKEVTTVHERVSRYVPASQYLYNLSSELPFAQILLYPLVIYQRKSDRSTQRDGIEQAKIPQLEATTFY